MRKFLTFISILSLLLPSLLLAAPTPESRVTDMISQVKQQKSMGAIMDFVHWPTTYAEMDPAAKKALDIKSAEDLRNHTKTFMTDPSKAMKKMLEQQMGGQDLPPEQMAMMESMMAAQFKKAKDEMDAEFNKFISSDHKIKSSEVTGETAKVVVESTRGEEVESNTLKMKLIDDQWWITDNDMVGKKAKM